MLATAARLPPHGLSESGRGEMIQVRRRTPPLSQRDQTSPSDTIPSHTSGLIACSVDFASSHARSEVGSLRRLRQLLVGGRRHVPADLDQHGLHGEVALPGCYAGELGEVDLRGEGKSRVSTCLFFLLLRRSSTTIRSKP